MHGVSTGPGVTGALPVKSATFKDEQPENASLRFVRVAGNVMLVRPVQFENVKSPRLITPSGIVRLVRPVQSANAPAPILTIPAGREMLFKLLQPENE